MYLYEKMNIPTVFFTIFLLACFVSVAAQQESMNHDIIVVSDNVVDVENIQKLFFQPIRVDEISFESDAIFQQEEFSYLFPFGCGDYIDSDRLITSLELCTKKNKFFKIKMTLFSGDEKARLHFTFEAAWTFKKIKIHNVYQGKHALSQLYVMERGEIFDEAKHAHSVEQIKQFLLNNGYFNCDVTSNLVYDQQTKEVVVHMFINKGKRFSFGSVDVVLTIEHGICDDNDDLCKQIKKKIVHALSSRSFTQEQLDKESAVVKEYLAKKGFFYSTIKCKQKIDHDHAVVNFVWKIDIAQKREIVFFGHRFFSEKELLEKVLVFGQSVYLLPATLLAEEIVRAYKSKGFFNAEVITQEEKDRSFFIIKEGPRAVVKLVEIKNGMFVHQDVIKKRFFGKLLKHKYYDAEFYDDAIAHLTHYYFDQGFVSFVVVNYECVPTNVENEYSLVVTIDEGARKYITSSIVEGYPEFSKQEFFCIQEGGVPFNSNIIDEQRAWLIAHFQALGFLRARFKSVIESHGDNVTIKWVVDAGEQIHFGKTVVSGSLSLPFSYIERLLCYQEGDLWDQAKIKQTYKAFKDLEIFELVHISTDTLRQAQGERGSENKSINLKLHLDDRYEIRTRAGFELQHLRKYHIFTGPAYRVGGTVIVKNPTNCADQIRFDCDFATSHREIVGKYRRPCFTQKPFFILAQVYSTLYDQFGFIGSVNSVYTVLQHGFFCGLQKKNQRSDFGCNIGFDWTKLHISDKEEPLSFARAIDFKPQYLEKLVPFIFIEPTFMFECVDDVLNPTHGGIGLISLKGMFPLNKKYKDTSFFKILFEQSFFIPLKYAVAAFRFRCGHIFYREFSGIMPSERFYLGGSHSLRSYESDLAPPVGVFEDFDGAKRVVPRGGRTMVNGNIELRFPLYKKMGAVLFQDLGALSGRMFADFKPQDLLTATGFGLRFFTPVGPLRFDIGWKWHKQIPEERSFAWFLTFGQAF
jgi:outer membrane protein assembly factor BamA